MWEKINTVWVTLSSCFSNIYLVAPIVLQWRTKIPSFYSMRCPSSSHNWFSWTITFVPGRASGVVFYLNLPWSWAYPDSFGSCTISGVSLVWDWRVSILHHGSSGKTLCVLASLAMKWSLKGQMARSDEFLLWMWGGTNWNFSFTSLINFLITLGNSLSRMCRLGFKTLLDNRLWSFLVGCL